MLAGGTVGDLHGHRRVLLAGLAVVGIGSLGCGAAPGVGILVAGRAVQGIGAALLLPGTLAIISDTFADAGERARAIGIWAGVGSLALPGGPARRRSSDRRLRLAVRLPPQRPDRAPALAVGVAGAVSG
jgi:DHA2 family methylenomycin A resistance protein-like MFS transporter